MAWRFNGDPGLHEDFPRQFSGGRATIAAIAGGPRKIPISGPPLALCPSNKQHAAAAADHDRGFADLLDRQLAASRGDQFVQPVSMRRAKNRYRTSAHSGSRGRQIRLPSSISA